MLDEDGARTTRQAPARTRYSDLHHRDELRGAELRGQDRARTRSDDGGHRHLFRRGWHDSRRAPLLLQVVLPVHTIALRFQSPPPAPRRRLRVLHRSGLQGRPRWAPDGAEGHRPGGGDAFSAGRHRPALARAPSRLAGPRRSRAQDSGGARGDELGDPDPAQARRRPRLRRCAHGGQDRSRLYLHGRHGGRHRRRTSPCVGGDGDPGDRRHPAGAKGVGRRGQERRNLSGLRGRNPKRRGRGEGARARGRRSRDRPLLVDGAQLQQGHPRGGLRSGDGGRGRVLLPLPHRTLSSGRRNPGIRSCVRASIPTRRRNACTTSCTASPSSAR